MSATTAPGPLFHQEQTESGSLVTFKINPSENRLTVLDSADDSDTEHFHALTALEDDGPPWFGPERIALDSAAQDRVQAQIVRGFHRMLWDMPTLCNTYEQILDWLAERFNVHFGVVSEVYIENKRTGKVTPYTTTDVREALDAHLTTMIEG